METKAVVTNREEAIELIKNDERYIKMTEAFSSKNEGIINTIDYSFDEIKLHINKKKWFGNSVVIAQLFDKIIKENNISNFIEVCTNKAEYWICVM